VADVLGRKPSIGFVHLQVAVAMHGPMGPRGKTGTAPEVTAATPTFRLLEEFFDLLLCRACGYRCVRRIMCSSYKRNSFSSGQTLEDPPSERVPLHVLHAAFDLALMPGI